MDGLELLSQAHLAGLTIRALGDTLVIRGPRSAEGLAKQLLEHKSAVMVQLRRCNELMDVPFPLGCAGLPLGEVVKAEASNDRLGVIRPVDRRLNVLSWMRCHYRDMGDIGMATQMKEAYHELRHADPSIQAICGICCSNDEPENGG